MSFKKKIRHSIEALIAVLKERNEIPIITEKSNDVFLLGKVALVTGGTGGIGLAIANKLSNCGCKVIITGTTQEKINSVIKSNPNLKGIVLNYRDISSFDTCISKAIEIYGKLDILVCSSGVHINRDGFDWNNITESDYDFCMDVNLKGTYFIIQKVAKYMVEKQIKGHILVISSQSALEPSWSPYRLSKLGIDGVVKGMAQKLIKYGIIVNAIGPGPTATSMQPIGIKGSIYTKDNPLERMTMPEEIAEYAKLLVSDLGNMIVGDTIYMSAGRGIIDKR